MDYKIYTCTCNFLNHGVGGITDEMTIYKHVLKNQKQKHRFSDTFCISRSAFYSVFTVHIKDQKKKKQMSMTRKDHNHTLHTKTRPDNIMQFIKQRNQFNFERNFMRKNVCPFQYLLSLMLSHSM